MAYTQADLDAVDEAIASGALLVKYNDREVRYRSLDDLYRIRNNIAAEVTGSNTPTQQRVRYRRPGGRGEC